MSTAETILYKKRPDGSHDELSIHIYIYIYIHIYYTCISLSLSLSIYIYIYIYTCTYIYISKIYHTVFLTICSRTSMSRKPLTTMVTPSATNEQLGFQGFPGKQGSGTQTTSYSIEQTWCMKAWRWRYHTTLNCGNIVLLSCGNMTSSNSLDLGEILSTESPIDKPRKTLHWPLRTATTPSNKDAANQQLAS